MVKERYGKVAEQSKSKKSSCGCGCNSTDTVDYSVFDLDYTKLKGYNPDADLSLGCGLPTQFAKIKEGDTVIDLGSGAGNDVFVARALVGEKGKVIGIDFTEEMIEKANENKRKLGLNNVQFLLGDIENLPVEDNIADVVISNCVLNLVPDKVKAFNEIYRILKPGGHISELTPAIKSVAELYAACVSGAIEKSEYLNIMKNSGLINIRIDKENAINLPDETILKYINKEDLEDYRKSGVGIVSINVYAEKPAEK
jgi:ubiquinone/menaquinone biosynthesis C-methylase UbiE